MSGKDWFSHKASVYIAALITICFVAQQTLLAKDTISYTRYMRQIINDYNAHGDGLVEYAPPAISDTSQDYIRTIEPGTPFVDFFIQSIPVSQGTKYKPLRLLKPEDYEAVASPATFYTPANKFPGNAPVYYKEGGNWLWIAPGTGGCGRFRASLKPVDFNHEVGIIVKLKFMVSPGSYPAVEELEVDTLDTRFGTSCRIKLPLVRKIAGVDTVER